MRNVNKGGSHAVVELCKLGSHGCTKLCVQVGERLVEQEDLRVADDCTSQSDTLFLTAGQRLRLSVEQVRDIQNARGFLNLLLDDFLRNFAQLQTERHVLEHRHMRIQSVVLEHHCDLTILRCNIVDQTVADAQFAFGNLFQTRDHTQGCGFTATGRSDQNQKLLVFDLQIEIGNGSYAARILFIDMLQRYACHLFVILLCPVRDNKITSIIVPDFCPKRKSLFLQIFRLGFVQHCQIGSFFCEQNADLGFSTP